MKTNYLSILLLLPATTVLSLSDNDDTAEPASFDINEVIICATNQTYDKTEKSNYCSLNGRYLFRLYRVADAVDASLMLPQAAATYAAAKAIVAADAGEGFTLPDIQVLSSVVTFDSGAGASETFSNYPVINNWFDRGDVAPADIIATGQVVSSSELDGGANVLLLNLADRSVVKHATTAVSQTYYVLGVAEYFQIVSMDGSQSLCVDFDSNDEASIALQTCNATDISQRWRLNSNKLVNQFKKSDGSSNLKEFCLTEDSGGALSISTCSDSGVDTWSITEDADNDEANVRLSNSSGYLQANSSSLAVAADDDANDQRWTFQY